MKLLLSVFIFFASFTFMNLQASAVQETTISASPAIIDLAIEPGKKTNAEITIRNGGEFGLPISIVPKSITTDEDIFVNKDRTVPDASRWIEIDESEFILSPVEIKKVPVIINTPEDVSSGGYYSEISIRGLSLEQNIEQGTSIVIPEIAITMLLTVPGETTLSMEISDNIIPIFATPRTDYVSNFSVTNNGNIHDLVTPQFVVEKNGEEIYRQDLSSLIILPNSKKKFTEILQLPDSYGVYEAYIELSYGNGQEIVKTNPEKLIVVPPLMNIFIVGFMTICSLYIYNHRNNLKASWKALTKGL